MSGDGDGDGWMDGYGDAAGVGELVAGTGPSDGGGAVLHQLRRAVLQVPR